VFECTGPTRTPITISRDDYTMTIANVKVQVKIDSAVCEANPRMQQLLQKALNDGFLGVQ